MQLHTNKAKESSMLIMWELSSYCLSADLKNAVCRECGKIGHIDKVFRSKQKTATSSEKEEQQGARTSKEHSHKKKSSTEQDCVTISKEYSVSHV